MKKIYIYLLVALFGTLSANAQSQNNRTIPVKNSDESVLMKDDAKDKIRSDIRKRRSHRRGDMVKAKRGAENRIQRGKSN